MSAARISQLHWIILSDVLTDDGWLFDQSNLTGSITTAPVLC